MILHGRNIFVYQNGVAIAAAKSCEIHVDCEKVEVATQHSDEWREYEAGRKTWNVKITTLVVSVSGHLMNIGDSLRLTFGSVDELKRLGADRLTGYALCTNADVVAQVGSLAKGSFQFDGSGGLERVMVNLRDVNDNNLLDADGNQLRVMEELGNLI